MLPETPPDHQRRSLQAAIKRTGLTHEALWVRYFSIGGDAGPTELDAYLNGLMPLDATQRDILAHAVNERLDELAWSHRVPYTRPLPPPEPTGSAPLAALTRLLEGIHMSPPGQLPRVVHSAGQALGVGLRMHLVDYDQRRLVAVAAAGHAVEEPLGLDSTLAGRAFRRVEWVVQPGEGPTLWIPLLDGVERLGVVEAVLPAGADPLDPELRVWLGWLCSLLGHLVIIEARYGDDLDAVRRHRPRTVAAELLWQLLPPLTFGTERFVVTGLVEPCYDAGGDAFDYALRGDTAHVAIFDATGHSLDAGTVVAVALAAYRSARRNGAALYDTVRLIDETLAEQFSGQRFVTAALGELDLPSGRLRYVGAGHPPPLVFREGKVVKSLEQGRRPLLGLGGSELTVGEERLQPGDWLVLHTDGVTEARDENGAFFGRERLADFLEREAATDNPPPETLRRLFRAVLDHQHGVLQDDATVVLAQWAGSGTADAQPG